MKKTAVLIIVILLISLSLFACTTKDESVVTIIVPDGPPALALAYLMETKPTLGGKKIKIEIVEGTNVALKLTARQADLAIMPTNLASKVYTQTSAITLLSANMFGNLYLMTTEEPISLSQVRGEEILCTGMGGVPDFVLQAVLQSNGIDADIKYINQGSEAIALLKTGKAKYALLGEPVASMAEINAGAKRLVDMQAAWESLTGSNGYPQACAVTTNKFLAENKAAVDEFLVYLQENLNYLETVDIAKLNEMMQAYGCVTSYANRKVIENCRIGFKSALIAREEVDNYLEIIGARDANFVGSLPMPSGFYYAA